MHELVNDHMDSQNISVIFFLSFGRVSLFVSSGCLDFTNCNP